MVLTFFGIAGKRLWFGSDSKLFFFGMVMVFTFVGIDSRSGFEQKGYGLVPTQSFFFLVWLRFWRFLVSTQRVVSNKKVMVLLKPGNKLLLNWHQQLLFFKTPNLSSLFGRKSNIALVLFVLKKKKTPIWRKEHKKNQINDQLHLVRRSLR